MFLVPLNRLRGLRQNTHYSKACAAVFYLLFACNLPDVQAQEKDYQKTAEVDPFVCSSGDHGQLTPSASLPFGLVKLGAATDPTNQAGYDYQSKKIKGFTINRMEGVGCNGAGGNILIKPGLGKISKLSYLYNKNSEKASPGYYQVNFQEPDIKAELTVSNGTGWQKYIYNDNAAGWLMIDLSASLEKLIAEDHTVKGNTITGSIKAQSVCKLGTYQFYYHIDIDKPADSVRQHGSLIWYFFTVKKGEVVNVKTSISSVSSKQALADERKEIGPRGFETIARQASSQWEQALGKINVKGKDEYVKLFYTHYYHTMLSPFRLSPVADTYRGSDGNLYRQDGFTYYHGWSLWDNFRTEMPLLTITEPAVMNDVCRSLIALYKQGKKPWATDTEPSPTVRTEHAIIVLLDCYRKGINRFDLASVYPLLKKEAENYPLSSPDQQLETAYDYWALSKIAGILNKREDEKMFAAKAGNYKSIWNDKFMQMGDNADSIGAEGLYEGTLWQYRWFVPYDLKGLQDMLGKQAFLTQLEYFFDQHLYNHANEPDIQTPYLFNFTSKPYLTQKIVNQLLVKTVEDDYATHKKFTKPYIGRVYKLDREGFVPEMDDDAGTMSAWFVLSSMGLYPANVGDPVYCLTSPIFSSVSIHLPGHKIFKIVSKNLSDDNFYIQKAFLNGKVLKRCWITQKEITSGGTLEFVLGKTPNPSWGLESPYVTALKP